MSTDGEAHSQFIWILIQKMQRNLVNANGSELKAITLPLSTVEHIPLRLVIPHVFPLGLRLTLAETL